MTKTLGFQNSEECLGLTIMALSGALKEKDQEFLAKAMREYARLYSDEQQKISVHQRVA